MIVEGETGIFIPLNDVAAAAEKITSILPETIRKQMGKQGQQRVETYFSSTAFEKNLIEAVET
jgi:glycosyltransferase involved in cell wall biosynthesis